MPKIDRSAVPPSSAAPKATTAEVNAAYTKARDSMKKMLDQAPVDENKQALLGFDPFKAWVDKSLGPIDKLEGQRAADAAHLMRELLPKLSVNPRSIAKAFLERIEARPGANSSEVRRQHISWEPPPNARRVGWSAGPTGETSEPTATRPAREERPVRYGSADEQYGARGSKGWSSSWNGATPSAWTGKR